MPTAKTTDDYMNTEGAKSAVQVVQEKMDSGSSAEDVVRSLAESGLRVYSKEEMGEYEGDQSGAETAMTSGPDSMLGGPEGGEESEGEEAEEGGKGGMKGLTILAIRSALKEDSRKKEEKRKESEESEG